ncbi:MAG: sigma-70 family RNA polymerase sigma factor [Acidobacteria bacterium]|nr:sigma-70 family RNA polymerase sigma factor [Acidobacteriota bacterium]
MDGTKAVGPGTSSSSSHELLERARKGDSGALNRLFHRYLPQLHQFAHRRVPPWARDAADTGDMVQETVLRTLGRLDSFEPQRDGALLGYLRRSLLNRIRDQFRRASRRPPVDPLVNGIGE